MAIKEISTNLEAFWMFNRSGKEARPSSQINQAEISPGSGIDEEEVGTLTWDDKKPKKKGSINSLKRGDQVLQLQKRRSWHKGMPVTKESLCRVQIPRWRTSGQTGQCMSSRSTPLSQNKLLHT